MSPRNEQELVDELSRDIRDHWSRDMPVTERRYIARALIAQGWTKTTGESQ